MSECIIIYWAWLFAMFLCVGVGCNIVFILSRYKFISIDDWIKCNGFGVSFPRFIILFLMMMWTLLFWIIVAIAVANVMSCMVVI